MHGGSLPLMLALPLPPVHGFPEPPGVLIVTVLNDSVSSLASGFAAGGE
jgi:hypothetical protein